MVKNVSLYTCTAAETVESESLPEVVDDADAGDEQSIKEACDELTDHFKHRIVEALLRATRYSLDVMRKRFFSRWEFTQSEKSSMIIGKRNCVALKPNESYF